MAVKAKLIGYIGDAPPRYWWERPMVRHVLRGLALSALILAAGAVWILGR